MQNQKDTLADESLLSWDFIVTLAKGRNEPQWLLDERKKAFSLFEKMHMPTLKYGIGVQTNLNQLTFETVDPSVDVEVSLEMDETKDVYVSDLTTALKTHEALIKQYMFKAVSYEGNKFTALAAAFLNSGTFVYIPKDVELSSPIVIQSKVNEGSIFDYVLIVAEQNAKATVYDIVHQGQKEGVRSAIVEVVALEGSKVNYVGIQALNKKTYQFLAKCSHAHKDAEVNWFDCHLGAKTTVLDLRSQLVGQGSKTNNISMFVGEDEQHYDLTIASEHLAPSTTSDMLSRGVLMGKSRVIFNGLVKIAQTASNSNGFQTQNTLLLSDQVRADATPKLEIDNNDVKCSHATTIGKVDEDQLFYVMSRGLTKQEAEQKIVEGFFVPLFQRANIPQLQQRVEKELGRIKHA